MPDFTRFPVAAGGLERVAGAGAIDQDALLPNEAARSQKPRIDLGLRGHVDAAEHAADLARHKLAQLGVQIEQRDLDPMTGLDAPSPRPSRKRRR